MNKEFNSKKNIIIATCGTGGHVIPAINLALDFKINNPSVIIHLILDERGSLYLTKFKEDINNIENIIIFKVRRKSGLFLYYFDLFLVFIKLIIFIIKNKIDAVVSFGSYIGFLSVISAFLSLKPSFLYVSDIVLSRSIKINLFFVTRFFYNFHQTKIPKFALNKSINVGYPFSKEISDYISVTNFYKNTDSINNHYSYIVDSLTANINILILGGSQGSQFLTNISKEALALLDKDLLLRLNVYHQCRNEDIKELKYFYIKNNIISEVKPFFQDIFSIMSKSHIVISRAGMASISELCLAGSPSILIPLSSAKDNHQFFNAKVLSDNNAAILLEEKDVNVIKLSNLLKRILNDFSLISNLHKNIKKIAPKDAKREMQETILSFIV